MSSASSAAASSSSSSAAPSASQQGKKKTQQSAHSSKATTSSSSTMAQSAPFRNASLLSDSDTDHPTQRSKPKSTAAKDNDEDEEEEEEEEEQQEEEEEEEVEPATQELESSQSRKEPLHSPKEYESYTPHRALQLCADPSDRALQELTELLDVRGIDWINSVRTQIGDSTKPDPSGWSHVHFASMLPRHHTLQLLYSRGATMNHLTLHKYRNLAPGSTCLHVAVSESRHDCFTYLLSLSDESFVNYKNVLKQTPMDLVDGLPSAAREKFRATFAEWNAINKKRSESEESGENASPPESPASNKRNPKDVRVKDEQDEEDEDQQEQTKEKGKDKEKQKKKKDKEKEKSKSTGKEKSTEAKKSDSPDSPAAESKRGRKKKVIVEDDVDEEMNADDAQNEEEKLEESAADRKAREKREKAEKKEKEKVARKAAAAAAEEPEADEEAQDMEEDVEEEEETDEEFLRRALEEVKQMEAKEARIKARIEKAAAQAAAAAAAATPSPATRKSMRRGSMSATEEQQETVLAPSKPIPAGEAPSTPQSKRGRKSAESKQQSEPEATSAQNEDESMLSEEEKSKAERRARKLAKKQAKADRAAAAAAADEGNQQTEAAADASIDPSPGSNKTVAIDVRAERPPRSPLLAASSTHQPALSSSMRSKASGKSTTTTSSTSSPSLHPIAQVPASTTPATVTPATSDPSAITECKYCITDKLLSPTKSIVCDGARPKCKRCKSLHIACDYKPREEVLREFEAEEQEGKDDEATQEAPQQEEKLESRGSRRRLTTTTAGATVPSPPKPAATAAAAPISSSKKSNAPATINPAAAAEGAIGHFSSAPSDSSQPHSPEVPPFRPPSMSMDSPELPKEFAKNARSASSIPKSRDITTSSAAAAPSSTSAVTSYSEFASNKERREAKRKIAELDNSRTNATTAVINDATEATVAASTAAASDQEGSAATRSKSRPQDDTNVGSPAVKPTSTVPSSEETSAGPDASQSKKKKGRSAKKQQEEEQQAMHGENEKEAEYVSVVEEKEQVESTVIIAATPVAPSPPHRTESNQQPAVVRTHSAVQETLAMAAVSVAPLTPTVSTGVLAAATTPLSSMLPTDYYPLMQNPTPFASIDQLLSHIGLSSYLPVFVKEELNIPRVLLLTREEVDALLPTIGSRKELWRFIQRVNQEQEQQQKEMDEERASRMEVDENDELDKYSVSRPRFSNASQSNKARLSATPSRPIQTNSRGATPVAAGSKRKRVADDGNDNTHATETEDADMSLDASQEFDKKAATENNEDDEPGLPVGASAAAASLSQLVTDSPNRTAVQYPKPPLKKHFSSSKTQMSKVNFCPAKQSQYQQQQRQFQQKQLHSNGNKHSKFSSDSSHRKKQKHFQSQ